MKIKFILIICIFLSLGFISAAMDPALGYCEHMGYESDYENCLFEEGVSCPLWDFYRGDCGQEYVKEIPCRKQGEVVFAEFEECCGNLKPYLPTRFFGQTSCQPLSVRLKGEFQYNPLYWLGVLILVIIGIYILYRMRKKK